MKKQSIIFQKTVDHFRKLGYTVDTKLVTIHIVKSHPDYWFALISGMDIKGGFCEPNNEDSYWYINGRISFDHKDCFDKWNKCPYCLKLPETMQDFKYIAECMDYLRTEEGFKKSNCYEINENNYPHSKYIICPTCKGFKRVMGKIKSKMCPKCKSKGEIKRPISNKPSLKESV